METQTLESVLIDAIQKTQGAVGEAVDFVVEQSPEVVQQLLLWNFTISLIWFCVGWIGIFVSYKIFRFLISQSPPERGETWAYKVWSDGDVWMNPALVFSHVFNAALAFCCLIAVLSHLTWLKIWIAPKLYLLEYAASLIK